MTNKTKYYKSAMIAGISLVIMAIIAGFSYGFVFNSLVVANNSMETLNNLINAKSLFTFGVIGWFAIIITDLIVSLSLYIFLKDIDKKVSAFAAFLRLAYTLLLTLSATKLVSVNKLTLNVSEANESLAREVMSLLSAFEKVWSYGLIIFGVHLLLVGLVTYKSRYVPKLISILLIIAGLSYTLLNLMYGVLPQIDSYTKILEMILVLPMTIGELAFAIWLLIKGRKLTEVN
ncbi:MAG: DUF4386 domain-containing protein [Acidaminobacteraceae bacterium]